MLNLLVAIVLVAVLHLSSAPAPLPCKDSNMCSKGISKTFVGDIRNSSNFLRMLHEVSFKKEIIFAAAGLPSRASPGNWAASGPDHNSHYSRIGAMDMPLQLADELLSMGYAHFLLVSSHIDQICKAIQPIRPDTSCVWDSLDLSKAGLGLLHYKIMFIARAVRAGYNVMALDGDVIVFNDPYHILWTTPVIQEANFICIPEGGSAYNCNAGFMYSRNASPSGPVVWVWYDIIRTMLRRADEGLKVCLTFDQTLIADSLSTSATGLPLYYEAVRACKDESTTFIASNGQQLMHPQVIKNMMAMRLDRGNRTKIMPSQAFMDEFGIKSFKREEAEFFYGLLAVPNLCYGRGEEFGGLLYADEGSLGPLASTWQQRLKDDNPDAHWFKEDEALSEEEKKRYESNFPDPADHSNMRYVHTVPYFFHRPDIKQEVFAHSPHWLTMSIQASPKGLHTGRQVSAKDGPKRPGPYLSIGYIHGLAIGPDKLVYRKILGKYNWTLAAQISSQVNRTPYTLGGRKIDQVLALHHHVDLSRTRNLSEFNTLLMGLAQAAQFSRRILVLPTLPCETSWLDKGQGSGDRSPCVAPIPHGLMPENPIYFPVDSNGFMIGGWTRRRVLLNDDSGERTTMEDPWWKDQKYRAIPGGFGRICATDMHAIIAPEYYHWLVTTYKGHRTSEVKPTPSNTAFVASSSADFKLKSDTLSHGWSLVDVQAAIPVTEAIMEMRRFADEPILFIGHPIMLRKSDDAKGEGEGFIHTNATHVDPDALLGRLNHKFKASRCRWLKKRADVMDPVDVDHGIKAIMDQGRIIKA